MNSVDADGQLYVSLTLIEKDLIPDDISSKLGINPDKSFRQGDTHQNNDGKIIVRRHGYWEIESSNKNLPSNDIVLHFRWLLDLIEPVKNDLQEILKDTKIKARLSCFWIVTDGRINVEIEPELIARLASLNVKMWFDIYSDKS